MVAFHILEVYVATLAALQHCYTVATVLQAFDSPSTARHLACSRSARRPRPQQDPNPGRGSKIRSFRCDSLAEDVLMKP